MRQARTAHTSPGGGLSSQGSPLQPPQWPPAAQHLYRMLELTLPNTATMGDITSSFASLSRGPVKTGKERERRAQIPNPLDFAFWDTDVSKSLAATQGLH